MKIFPFNPIHTFNFRLDRWMVAMVAVITLSVQVFIKTRDWLYEQLQYEGWEFWLFGFTDLLGSLIISVSIFTLNIGLIRYLQSIFPSNRQMFRRWVIELALTSLIAISIIILVNLLSHYYIHPKHSLSAYLFDSGVAGLAINLLMVVLYESLEIFKQWKVGLIRNQEIEKEKIRFKYEVLKNQVNPHFLFNSLNVLTSLIPSDPDKAEQFTYQLSRIYQYVLDTKDIPLVKLEQEIRFIKTYFNLLQTRFADAIQLEVDLDQDKLQEQMPPLTLQLLLENAIKHNNIGAKHPLKVNIHMDANDRHLIIRNNIQQRQFSPPSNGLGLKTITERYRMLCKELPHFTANGKEYIARVPLIDPAT